jgi:hypothetical protein
MKKTGNVKKDRLIAGPSNPERTFPPCVASLLHLFLLTGVCLCFFIPSLSWGEGVTLTEDDSVGSFPSRFFTDPGL